MTHPANLLPDDLCTDHFSCADVLMSDGDSGWAERVTGHTPALSADGVIQHKKLHAHQPPVISVSAHPPVDRAPTPQAANGGLSLRGYVGRLQAKARSAGRAIAGVHSPRLKHSLSDDMELGGFGLLNGTGHRSAFEHPCDYDDNCLSRRLGPAQLTPHPAADQCYRHCSWP